MKNVLDDYPADIDLILLASDVSQCRRLRSDACTQVPRVHDYMAFAQQEQGRRFKSNGAGEVMQ